MKAPSGSYRILVVEGQKARPLQGMRLASDAAERERLLTDLRAMCPEETFTYESLRPSGDVSWLRS